MVPGAPSAIVRRWQVDTLPLGVAQVWCVASVVPGCWSEVVQIPGMGSRLGQASPAQPKKNGCEPTWLCGQRNPVPDGYVLRPLAISWDAACVFRPAAHAPQPGASPLYPMARCRSQPIPCPWRPWPAASVPSTFPPGPPRQRRTISSP